MAKTSTATVKPDITARCAAPAVPHPGSSNITTAEAVRIVNAAIAATRPGPETYTAVAPASVDAYWEDGLDGMTIPVAKWPQVDKAVAEQRRDYRRWTFIRAVEHKLDDVYGAIHRELKPRIHQLPEVAIVNVTHGIVIMLHGYGKGMLTPACAARIRRSA